MPGRLRLRSFVDDSFDAERHSRGNLLELPFFTGKRKLVDTAGRVERFQRKYGKRNESFRLTADADTKIQPQRNEDRGSRIED